MSVFGGVPACGSSLARCRLELAVSRLPVSSAGRSDSPCSVVTVYWRPGCPYCSYLRRGLRRAGLPRREINIWKDPVAAAAVRAHAGGNETVPTVTVGELVMVNPTTDEVIDAARAAGPEGLGSADVPMEKRPVTVLRGVQWLIIVGLVIGSFVAEGAGHSALSWSLDGVAVAAYLLMRSLIRWQEADPRRMKRDSVSPIPDCDSGVLARLRFVGSELSDLIRGMPGRNG